MKWQWKNCPLAWRGAYQEKERVPTVALEAIVDHRLWFWHLFSSMPGANNDNNYDMAYYLTDGIYPDWALFMKTISEPSSIKQQHFCEQQEARRKDVEHGFSVLQVGGLHFVFCYFLL
jgi:hypothetical protein